MNFRHNLIKFLSNAKKKTKNKMFNACRKNMKKTME